MTEMTKKKKFLYRIYIYTFLKKTIYIYLYIKEFGKNAVILSHDEDPAFDLEKSGNDKMTKMILS